MINTQLIHHLLMHSRHPDSIYNDRQLTFIFELWLKFFVCRHVSIRVFRNRVCLSQIPLQMSYSLAKACLFCIPSHFVTHSDRVTSDMRILSQNTNCDKDLLQDMYAHTRWDMSLRPKSRDMYAGVH